MASDKRIALVTGASRGIGRAISLELGGQGHVVVGTATSEGGAEGIGAYLESARIEGCGLVLDVSDAGSIRQTLETVVERYGAPVILVNNAGITRDNLMMRMKDEEWDAILATNLTSVFRVSRACLRAMMKARWGRIVNIASVVGATGNAGQTNYAAAKAGMIGLTKSLAREVGTRGITVNAVAPGFIDTDMTRALDEEQRNELTRQIPLGRLGRPEHVAAAVGFLTTDAAEYMTGETLHVNGGMFMA